MRQQTRFEFYDKEMFRGQVYNSAYNYITFAPFNLPLFLIVIKQLQKERYQNPVQIQRMTLQCFKPHIIKSSSIPITKSKVSNVTCVPRKCWIRILFDPSANRLHSNTFSPVSKRLFTCEKLNRIANFRIRDHASCHDCELEDYKWNIYLTLYSLN